jgi:hypothetical protein
VRLLDIKQPILLSAIHPFWRQNLASEDQSDYLPLLEPRLPILKAKKSNQGGGDQGRNSTGRKKAPSKCSNCGEIGHTIRLCKV